VTCKFVRAKKQRKIRCQVRQATASGMRARWRLARGGHTVAKGATRVRGGGVAISVSGVRSGRYRLTVLIGRGANVTALHQSLRIG
jgi:hypothetical protein